MTLESNPEKGAAEDPAWALRPLSALTAHIVATHHALTRRELARLRAPLEEVVRTEGAAHPQLATVRTLFDRLEADLVPHMMKEERVLFPFIEQLDAAARRGDAPPRAPFGTIENPIRMMRSEHDRDGAALFELEVVTRAFTVPPGASATFAALYDGLRALHADLHRHIALENDVLFPRAIASERARAGER